MRFGGLGFFWLNLLSEQRIPSQDQRSPLGVAGADEASCGSSFSLCFGNISHKDRNGGG